MNILFIFLINITILSTGAQTVLGPCDYKRFPSTGCRDQFGAECDVKSSQCICKEGYWKVVYGTFCFPEECSRGFYYDHESKRCESQSKASPTLKENHCTYDFHCQGDHVRCLPKGSNSWELKCTCNKGFVYDIATSECRPVKGVTGYCITDSNCHHEEIEFICLKNTCQCKTGFTYNSAIEGCEDNDYIQERDSQARTLIYIFIIMGILFGAALSMKFGSSDSTSAFLLKRIITSQSSNPPSAPPQMNHR